MTPEEAKQALDKFLPISSLSQALPPQELVQELGEAYRDYIIEIRELITLAYAAGFKSGMDSAHEPTSENN